MIRKVDGVGPVFCRLPFPVAHHVKGILFVDYVRMIRSHKGTDWSQALEPEDMALVLSRIDTDAWYPMESFERLGNAILEHVANGEAEAARLWGRVSVDPMLRLAPMLVCPEDPVESLMRFRVLRATFFDFPALFVATLVLDHADIEISYFMGPVAEEAASYQTMGFFERLLELSSATEIEASFTERSWAGDMRTLLALKWQPPRQKR
jgi:hypothetical protein